MLAQWRAVRGRVRVFPRVLLSFPCFLPSSVVSLPPAAMDYKGQNLSEQLFYYIVLIFGVGAGSGGVPTAAAGYPSGHAVDVFVGTVLSGVTIQVTATVIQSRHSFVTATH